jgi:hypothetical protein
MFAFDENRQSWEFLELEMIRAVGFQKSNVVSKLP